MYTQTAVFALDITTAEKITQRKYILHRNKQLSSIFTMSSFTIQCRMIEVKRRFQQFPPNYNAEASSLNVFT